MGRTVPTFRMVLEHVIRDWNAFRKALRSHDRAAFDAMMLRARQHAAAASNAARLNPTEALFMAILVEHEKALAQLEQLKKLESEQKTDDNVRAKARAGDNDDNASMDDGQE